MSTSSPDTTPRARADRRDRPQDDTRPVRSDDGSGRTPRLPHEHDESADSVAAQPNPDIKQAAHDVKRGLVDTDKGPPMDEAYRKQKR